MMINQRYSFMIVAALVVAATAQDCGEITRCSICLDSGCASSKKVCMETCSMARDGDSCYLATDYQDLDSDAICVLARDEELAEQEAGDATIVEAVIEAPSAAPDATDDATDDAPEGDLPQDVETLDEADFAANTTALEDFETFDGDEGTTPPAPDAPEEGKTKDNKDSDPDDDEGDEPSSPGLTISRADGSELASGAVAVGQWASLVVGACAMVATAMSN